MSDIRVTYSGLIAFVVGISSVITGMVFTLMVTRKLTPEEYGTWGVIVSIISYFLISETLISYWSTRQIARGYEVGKTALLTSSGFSIIAIPLYLIYINFVSKSGGVDLTSMIFGAILIPVYFVSQTLTGINMGHKPHVISYGLLIFELLKIPVGLALVVIFELGILGVIISIFVAYLARIGIQAYFAKEYLKQKFLVKTLKFWFKTSWLTIFSTIHRFIRLVDVVAYTVLIGSVLGIAYYTAAFVIAGIVMHSSLISQALYPKLLAQGDQKHVVNNFIHSLFFAIPLLGISIIFAKAAIFALNPSYEIAWIIVIFLAVKNFFLVLNQILARTIQGVDMVDIKQDPNFSKLIKSNLFRFTTVMNIQSSVYIGLLVIILSLSKLLEFSELNIVYWWAIISLAVEIPAFMYLWFYGKRFVKISFPKLYFLKYIGATIAFMLVFLLISDSIITYEISIYKFLPGLILQLLICIAIYLSITYVIDEKTRILFKSIFIEFNLRK